MNESVNNTIERDCDQLFNQSSSLSLSSSSSSSVLTSSVAAKSGIETREAIEVFGLVLESELRATDTSEAHEAGERIIESGVLRKDDDDVGDGNDGVNEGSKDSVVALDRCLEVVEIDDSREDIEKKLKIEGVHVRKRVDVDADGERIDVDEGRVDIYEERVDVGGKTVDFRSEFIEIASDAAEEERTGRIEIDPEASGESTSIGTTAEEARDPRSAAATAEEATSRRAAEEAIISRSTPEQVTKSRSIPEEATSSRELQTLVEEPELDTIKSPELTLKNQQKQLDSTKVTTQNAATKHQQETSASTSGLNVPKVGSANDDDDDDNNKKSLSLTKKWPPRSVTFPLNDQELVTGYLEPANPWAQAQDVSIDDLIAAYKESCDRHNSEPLSTVINQLKKLDLLNGRCEELNLKNEELDRNHSEPLEEVLKRLQFMKIDLESSSLDDESAETIFDMIEYYESAKHINISNNCNIGERGWQACSQMIKKTQCLEELDAKDIVLTQQHMNILKRPLQLVSQLQILKLENCGLAGRAFIILISALKVNTGLKELYLADNHLQKPDAVQLGALLRANHHLQLLDVSNNNLQDAGIRDVLDGLMSQSVESSEGQGLSVLVLWNNHISKDSSGRFADTLANSMSLETLNIGQNLMGDEFIEICKAALTKNNKLLQLGVQATGLMQKGILALAEIIEKNSTLQRIDLRDNNLQLTGLTFLSLALKKNDAITRIDLDDKCWSKSPPLIEQYAELVSEIRSYCLRNEDTISMDESTEELSSPEHRSRLSSVSSRKISLTCQTLPRSPPLLATASEVTGRTMMMPGNNINNNNNSNSTHSVPKRTSGGRLRSPAPSPIPSPVASPIPSPSRSRFVVSRVSEASLSSTNSSASSSPITPPSLPSPSCFFPGDGSSRFRVTVVSNSSTPTTPAPPPPINLPEFKVDVPEILDSDDSDSVFRSEPEDLRADSESSADVDISFDDQMFKDTGTCLSDDKSPLSPTISPIIPRTLAPQVRSVASVPTISSLFSTTSSQPTTTTHSITSATNVTKNADQSDALKHTSSLERLLGLFHNPGGIFTSAFDNSTARNPFHEGVNSMMALGDRFQRYLRESRVLEPVVSFSDVKCSEKHAMGERKVDRLREEERVDDVEKGRRVDGFEKGRRIDEVEKRRRVDMVDEGRKFERVDEEQRIDEVEKENRIDEVEKNNRIDGVEEEKRVHEVEKDNRVDRVEEEKSVDKVDEESRVNEVEKESRVERVEEEKIFDRIEEERRVDEVDEGRRVDEVNERLSSDDAKCFNVQVINESYVPAALEETFVDKDNKENNECLMLPRTFNNSNNNNNNNNSSNNNNNNVQTIICDSNTNSSINYPNYNNDTHHCNITCDVNNLLDNDDKDINNIPVIYENMSEASSIDENQDINNSSSRSQMNLYIDRSVNHRNSQDSGIEESNIIVANDEQFNDAHNRPRDHFQGSVDSGIESECSPICNKGNDSQEDEGCLKELRIALNIPVLDDNKTNNVDQLICQSVDGT